MKALVAVLIIWPSFTLH